MPTLTDLLETRADRRQLAFTELRRDSIAALVFTAGAAPNEPPRQRARTLLGDTLAAIVLGNAPPSGLRGFMFAVGAAIALHAGPGFLALHCSPQWLPKVANKSTRPALRIDHVVDLTSHEAPTAHAAPPPPEIARAAVPSAGARPLAQSPATSERLPAQAGQVVAAQQSPAEPLDFSAFDISTGSTRRYEGGDSRSLGRSNRPVQDGSVERGTGSRRVNQASRAQAVGLPAQAWRCPWPREADGVSSSEQIVVIRVVVRADGSVASARVLSDPGFGFAAVALACARDQRFRPATDDEGRAITATSPPVRVRFTRD